MSRTSEDREQLAPPYTGAAGSGICRLRASLERKKTTETAADDTLAKALSTVGSSSRGEAFIAPR